MCNNLITSRYDENKAILKNDNVNKTKISTYLTYTLHYFMKILKEEIRELHRIM